MCIEGMCGHQMGAEAREVAVGCKDIAVSRAFDEWPDGPGNHPHTMGH